MTNFAVPIAAPPSVRVVDSEKVFPVGRVFCVGRNFEAHAREMNVTTREPPFFFTKFPAAVVPSGTVLRYPPATANFHYEGELVVAIGSPGENVTLESAESLIFGYAAGLDMTRRDLQLAARGKGHPWDVSKNFEQSAPVGDIVPRVNGGSTGGASPASHPTGRPSGAANIVTPETTIELFVNGTLRQQAPLSEMIWSVPEIIVHLSKLYRLVPGDLIFTGTPAGVGPVVAEDEIEVRVLGLPSLKVRIAAAR
jgi:fumarylpyruvate hydrolase